MEQIQLIQITPEQLKEAILNGVQSQLDQLKNEFQPKQPTEYMTRSDVRDMLKVDMSTVHNWTKRGKLKAYGIGSRVYYKRNEVESVLKPIN